MMRLKSSKSSRGFTTTELLVVIGILVILLAILFPVFASARRSAKITLCAAHLRQMGQAIESYKSDNRGAFPIANDMPPPFDNHNQPPISLYVTIKNYLPANSGVYRCPRDDGQVFDRCAKLSANGYGLSYNYFVFPKDLHLQLMWDYMGDSVHGIISPQFHTRGCNFSFLGWKRGVSR